jgi:hypothetical protein
MPRKRPPELTFAASASKSVISPIENIKNEYNTLKEQLSVPQDRKKYESIELYINKLNCTEPIGKGASKTIKKCPVHEDINIVQVFNSDLDEILYHIKLLQILYSRDIDTSGFKIPNIYLKFNDTDTDINYFMDYIAITHPDNIKYGKFHAKNAKNAKNAAALYNIGKLIAKCANSTDKLLYDFELYTDENDGVLTLLDFGETIQLTDTIFSKYTYETNIYRGILEIIDKKFNIEKIIEEDTKTFEQYMTELEEMHKQKYLKYKRKYLQLKLKL